MPPIGFSTGILYWTGLPLIERLRHFKAAGATAVELNITEQEFLSFKPSEELVSLLNSFQFVSIHAPDELHRQALERFIAKIRQLRSIRFSAITIHPDATTDFSLLEKTGLPFAVENMDSKKQIVTDAAFFHSLTRYNLGAVLDIQHCYEHDRTMKLASDLAAAMKISHMHVSGQHGDNNHAFLFDAENSEAILTALKTLPRAPIILEGALPGYDVDEALRKELALALAPAGSVGTVYH